MFVGDAWLLVEFFFWEEDERRMGIMVNHDESTTSNSGSGQKLNYRLMPGHGIQQFLWCG